jgi:adenylate cyclase
MATERKLAAILAADIAGYSRLMEVDEEATLSALRIHRDLVEKLVTAHRGRVFSSAGDSVVVEFPSAVEATQCAVVLQREIELRNQTVPKGRRLLFRIGINIGDVVVEDGNLFGDGVNVAARIQALADPGGICVARNVHDQLRNKAGFEMTPMGTYQVKNIAMPIAVYKVLLGKGRRRHLGKWLAPLRPHRRAVALFSALLLIAVAGFSVWYWRPADAGSGFPSLAVIPFSNFSNDPKLSSYGDAVAEDMTTVLSRFPDISVVSRNSAFTYKGTSADPKQIGRELGVDYILEGSVQSRGETVEITAQLIDTRTNLHVWADKYEGTDLSSLQDDAAIRVGAMLPGDRGQIRANETKRIEGKDRSEFNEYDYFLSGQAIISRAETIEEHDRGGAILQEGLEKYPGSALLRVHMAWYHFWRPHQFEAPRRNVDYRRAAELAREALSGESASTLVELSGRTLLAFIEWQDGNFERAVANAERAVVLAPYDANTLSFLGRVQVASGNYNRGIAWLEESTQRKPELWRNTRILAWAYYLAGDYRKSIAAAHKHVELSREWAIDAMSSMATSYVNLGRMTEANATVDRINKVAPNFTLALVRAELLFRPYKDQAVSERELADLAAAGLPELQAGYDQKASQRLSVDEIKTLIFGHTLRGRDSRTGEVFTDVFSSDGAIKETADWGNDTATLAYLERGLMCHIWTDWGPGCSAVFRNPNGTRESQDEFILVFPYAELQFSIVE